MPPLNATGPGFPNRGQSLRRTSSGQLVPYHDGGEILGGAAQVRLEDGTMLRINYNGHNGYQFVLPSRILVERRIIPREEMSLERTGISNESRAGLAS
jgi:membrane-bound lytic murein transglycosylase A